MNTPIIKSIFSKFKKMRPEIELTANEMIEHLRPYDILLYGAGSSGIAFLYDLVKIGRRPLFFIDSNPSKIGKKCESIEIISPDDIQRKVHSNFLVIVCINTDGKRYCKSFDEALRIGGHHAVYQKLHEVGCENVIDYTFFRRCFSIFTHEKHNAPSVSDVDLMLEHEDNILNAYEYLDDELSRDTFKKIIEFRLLDDNIEVPTLPQDTQYFEKELYYPREDAVFVDCGAYNGISAKTFLSIQKNKFEHYYGMEPDYNNYLKLQEYINSLPSTYKEKMTISNNAVWNKKQNLKLYALDGPGSFIAQDIGKTIVQAITIDELLHASKATFIKMNIEGSEKQALEGAKNTIECYKPNLAIAGYHRPEDLWSSPIMIKDFRRDYIIKLRI